MELEKIQTSTMPGYYISPGVFEKTFTENNAVIESPFKDGVLWF